VSWKAIMRATSRPALLLLLAQAGCFLFRSAPPPPPPVAELPQEEPEPAAGPQEPFPIQLTLRASDRLNPDERGEPLPTVVMIYQLKSATKLAAADSDDVYRKPKEVLGEDLLQTEELQLAPGQVQTKTLERDKAAKALAVVALVRRPAGPSWRSIVELPPVDQPAELSFVLDGYRVDRQ
jgi:type VI secretion system VasD/TssJ family lipoprotein